MVYDFKLEGVRTTLMSTASSLMSQSFDASESTSYFDLTEQVLDRFRPDVLIIYGSYPVIRQVIMRASQTGTAVVFFLRNLAYSDRDLFEHTAGILVASDFVRLHYAQRLNLKWTVLPSPLRFDKVIAPNPDPRFLTFVNPVARKGTSVLVRIVLELDHLRPDIPILVADGRGTAEDLVKERLDLSGVRNLNRMANTTDPRDYYRVSRALLMPSLWSEPFGRVAAEALANGIPVLASDRGGLPQTLGGAGFVFSVPDRCTPTSGEIPTREEIRPWLDVIIRLWDDPDFEAAQRTRCQVAANRWEPDSLMNDYEKYIEIIILRYVLKNFI